MFRHLQFHFYSPLLPIVNILSRSSHGRSSATQATFMPQKPSELIWVHTSCGTIGFHVGLSAPKLLISFFLLLFSLSLLSLGWSCGVAVFRLKWCKFLSTSLALLASFKIIIINHPFKQTSGLPCTRCHLLLPGSPF